MPTLPELCVDEEFTGLAENAQLMGWSLHRKNATTFVLGLPARDGSRFWLKCVCERYSAEPPAWHWFNPDTEKLDDPKDMPKSDGRFFHSNNVICAPWNRLAYKSVDNRGPHDGDWNIGDWRNNPKTGGCRTLSAMALRIAHELSINLKGRAAA